MFGGVSGCGVVVRHTACPVSGRQGEVSSAESVLGRNARPTGTRTPTQVRPQLPGGYPGSREHLSYKAPFRV